MLLQCVLIAKIRKKSVTSDIGSSPRYSCQRDRTQQNDTRMHLPTGCYSKMIEQKKRKKKEAVMAAETG